VVIMRAPVLCARWHPLGDALAFCTASSQLYMWAPAGMSVVSLPAALKFRVQAMQWAPEGQSLVLHDVDRFCCCYLPESQAQAARAAARAASTMRAVEQEQQDPNRHGR
jgi:hypothetical protein